MTTRIIRITECAQCPHRMYGIGVCAIGSRNQVCPPEGTPEWCPLERLDIPDSISEETLAPFTKIGAYYVGRRAAIEDMEQGPNGSAGASSPPKED